MLKLCNRSPHLRHGAWSASLAPSCPPAYLPACQRSCIPCRREKTGYFPGAKGSKTRKQEHASMYTYYRTSFILHRTFRHTKSTRRRIHKSFACATHAKHCTSFFCVHAKDLCKYSNPDNKYGCTVFFYVKWLSALDSHSGRAVVPVNQRASPHTCTHACTPTCMHACTHTCANVRMHECTHARVYLNEAGRLEGPEVHGHKAP